MTTGLHHVTAIVGEAARNLAFHRDVLGQRLVKRTVNFDDPSCYHLYYGDTLGSPGSLLTVFPWAHMAAGRPGTGDVAEIALRVPQGSLGFWAARLAAAGAAVGPPQERFGAATLGFRDPDGLRLALVELDGIEAEPFWDGGGVGAEHALRGLWGVTLSLADPPATAALLTDVLGFAPGPTDGASSRLIAQDATRGGVVDLRADPAAPPARQGSGSVHHVAFRAADEAAQAAMARRLREVHGLGTTGSIDRCYFRSIYLRDPNGVIVELATDAPGFAVDEPADALGQTLALPAFLESRRGSIEATLPRLA